MMKNQQSNFQASHETSKEIQATNAPDQYYIDDFSKYPNCLLTFIEIKIYDISKKTDVVSIKGSGCLISSKYVLTAAHNIQPAITKIKEIENNKGKYKKTMVVKQGVKQDCICTFTIENSYYSQNYPKNPKEDFALLEVQPLQKPKIEMKQYMPILFLPGNIIKQLPVRLQGYPIEINKKLAQKEDDMNFQFGIYQPVEQVTKSTIVYNNPSEAGFSGGPLIAYYNKAFVIIGVHKGGNLNKQQNNVQKNVGINVGFMLEYLNQQGHKLEKKPFVYTEKTFQFRQKIKELNQSSLLLLINRGLQPCDILVLTGFDLSNMKKITLSSNIIGKLGVEYLLKRNFPNLTSLYMNDNYIQELPKDNWKNVNNLQYLGLGFNKLKTLPDSLSQLIKLKELWISTNQIEIIPKAIGEICQKNISNKSTVYIYGNSIDLQSNKDLINWLSTFKTQIVW